MATTLANISIKDNSSWNTYLNLIYPVGSVYISYKNTSPSSLFGGSWSVITGSFPYFNSGTSANTNPTHSHVYGVGGRDCYGAITTMYIWNNGTSPVECTNVYNSVKVPHNTGLRAESENNTSLGLYYRTANTSATKVLPPYQTLYAWRRTA